MLWHYQQHNRRKMQHDNESMHLEGVHAPHITSRKNLLDNVHVKGGVDAFGVPCHNDEFN